MNCGQGCEKLVPTTVPSTQEHEGAERAVVASAQGQKEGMKVLAKHADGQMTLFLCFNCFEDRRLAEVFAESEEASIPDNGPQASSHDSGAQASSQDHGSQPASEGDEFADKDLEDAIERSLREISVAESEDQDLARAIELSMEAAGQSQAP